MILAQTFKNAVFVGPSTVLATNATASARIDAQGAHGALITIAHGPAAATNSDAKWAVLSIGVSDTTTFSTSNRVSGLVGTTNSTASTSQFVLPAHNNTSNPSVIKLHLNNPTGRYIFLEYQPPASTVSSNIAAWAELYRLDQAPSSATEAGVSAWAFA